MTDISPAPIIASILGYFRTAAIQAAIRLDLFTRIAEGAEDPAALAQACDADARSLRSLCDFLVVDGHLMRDADRYRLTPSSATFLDRRSPAYMGSIEAFLASPENRDQALADPLAFMRKSGRARPGNLAPDNPVWVAYARAMLPLSTPVAKATAAALAPLAPHARKILDVAAGSGIFGIEMLRALPEARVVAIDWPDVLAVARENAARRKVGGRLDLLPGSALEVEFGAGFDMVLIPNFLHHFDEATSATLLRRARQALAPDGRVAIVEFIRSDGETPPEPVATFSLLMRATTPAGDACTIAGLERAAGAAGFTRFTVTPLGTTLQTLFVAR
jgi:2-polyprenyl-3-methyl-5-hydroxy-6-metoxy-1,4-benzoquinol methylase